MDFCRKTILLLIFSSFMSVGWGQDCVDGVEVELWGECYNIQTTTSLILTNNGLTGEIPSEIGQLTNLTYLGLSSNQLSGEIPSEIGNLTNLTALYLYSNQITGEIPESIGNLTNLTFLYLYNNQLTGEIPSEIGNLTNLTALYLFNNQLTGEIPSEIFGLTNLLRLYLQINQLTGEIPDGICNIGVIQIFNNQFCPPYPECLTENIIGDQDTSECCGGTGLPSGECDCEGNLYDECGICGGDGFPCDAQLSITNVNTSAGTLDIYMINEVEVAGFEFKLEGITITGVSGGLAGEYFDSVTFTYLEFGDYYKILGVSLFTLSTIPAGEGVLTTVSFSDYSDEICFVPNSSVFSDPYGSEISGLLGDCYTPPECDVALGDVNGDGDINIFDLVQIAYFILDLSIPNYECAADYNQDGSVDILDLVAIVNIILNP